MSLAEHQSVRPYLGRPAILDSNLLLLLWCVQFDSTLLLSFKRLQIDSRPFEREDFVLLTKLVGLFREVRTTPHVLTEVSNLANSLPEWRKQEWAAYFSEKVKVLTELSIAASSVVDDREAMLFGLTDAGLAQFADSCVILTADRKLARFLDSRQHAVINFNHLRQEWLLA